MVAWPARWPFPGCAVLLSLSACTAQQVAPAHATGQASWTMETPAASQRYTMAVGDMVTGSNLVRTVTPAYPASQLSACPPPQDVQVLLVVDKLGKVSEARVADEAQAGQHRLPFVVATRTAVTQWRFNPLQVQHAGRDATGNAVVISETRPFSLTYDFRFKCHNGQPTVTSGRATAQTP